MVKIHGEKIASENSCLFFFRCFFFLCYFFHGRWSDAMWNRAMKKKPKSVGGENSCKTSASNLNAIDFIWNQLNQPGFCFSSFVWPLNWLNVFIAYRSGVICVWIVEATYSMRQRNDLFMDGKNGPEKGTQFVDSSFSNEHRISSISLHFFTLVRSLINMQVVTHILYGMCAMLEFSRYSLRSTQIWNKTCRIVKVIREIVHTHTSTWVCRQSHNHQLNHHHHSESPPSRSTTQRSKRSIQWIIPSNRLFFNINALGL